MARKPTKAEAPIVQEVPDEEFKNPETATFDDGQDAVKNLPPANPFGEPIADEYPDGTNAELSRATLAPAETVVEHPLSPTDTNPNPHGTRDEPFTAVAFKDEDGKATRTAPDEGDKGVEVEGTSDNPVHLGDGRVLAKGSRAKVNPDLLKDENIKGKVKRV